MQHDSQSHACPQRDSSVADDASTVADTPATVKTVRPAKAAAEKTPEEQARADAIDIRCLSLCIGMLERVMGVCMHSTISCPIY